MSTRYLISFQIELLSPMHLGTGEERQLTPAEMPPDAAADQVRPFATVLAKGHDGRPIIPGPSLKGLLRAQAQAVGMPKDLQTLVFGSEQQTDAEASQPGCVECQSACLERPDPRPGMETRTGIDRVTRAVADGQLFNQEHLLPGVQFAARLVLHTDTPDTLHALCQLLQLCNQTQPLRIGAHQRAGWGAAVVTGLKVKTFGPKQLAAWWAAADTHWTSHAVNIKLHPVANGWATTKRHQPLAITLVFDGPFAVRDNRYHKTRGDLDAPDSRPRLRTINGVTHPLLPATSLLGALRSQGERILITLCHAGAKPLCQRILPGKPPLNMVQLAFGTEGWQGLLGCADDFLGEPSTRQPEQDMLAVCRFTGGGQDSAKFRAAWFESPRISGTLQLHTQRLGKLPQPTQQAVLGLLTLIWRDLAEGDITLGMGRSKGWGHCLSPGLMQAWRDCLQALGYTPEVTLQALRTQGHTIHTATASPAPTLKTALQGGTKAPVATTNTRPTAPAPANAATTDRFHNPYAFVPLAAPNSKAWTTWADVQQKPQHPHRHDHYQGLSGRLQVRLKTLTPLFVGARQTPGATNQPNSAEHYERPHHGEQQAALPATSLRGMLSSLHESLTSANLRVLNNSLLSVRKPMKEALSALGRVIRRGDQWMLEPLCPPTMNFNNKYGCYELPRKFTHLFDSTRAPLRLLLNTMPTHPNCKDYHYIKAHAVDWAIYEVDGTDCKVIEGQAHKLRHPTIKGEHDPRRGQPDTTYLIGRKPDGAEKMLTQAEYDALKSEAEKKPYVRGFVRTIKAWGRDIPNTVTHATFVPYGELRDGMSDAQRGLQAIPDHVLQAFHTLSDQARDQAGKASLQIATNTTLLPYTPVGRPTTQDRMERPDRATRLQEGDLVYFDVDSHGAISELSFSALWRKQVDWVCQFFDEDLLPLGTSTQPRGALSPTEWLFGVVSQRPAGANPTPGAQTEIRAWAGKVRISDALPTQPTVQRLLAVTLKELSSPKPPSPALYFRPKQNSRDSYVSKQNLAATPQNYQPNGRKHYLHPMRQPNGPTTELPPVQRLNNNGYPDAQGQEPWVSQHNGRTDTGNKRRIRVAPVEQGQTFDFTLDFDNLSPQELQALCASIQPTETYAHRLGMGKPLGLGSVELRIQSIEFVDRQNRYLQQDPTTAERCAWVQHTDEAGQPSDPLHQLAQQLASAGFNHAAPAVRQALTLLGNPRNTRVPVHYPQMANAPTEREHFKWFVHNDRQHQNPQALKPLNANSNDLPWLNRPDPDTLQRTPAGNWNRR